MIGVVSRSNPAEFCEIACSGEAATYSRQSFVCYPDEHFLQCIFDAHLTEGQEILSTFEEASEQLICTDVMVI